MNPQYSDAVTQSDLVFWPDRFKDHCMLLYILLDPQKVNTLKMSANQQMQNWDHYLKTQNQNLLRQLIPVLWNLKNTVLDLAKIRPINLVLQPNDFISLVTHMIEELTFFLRITSPEGLSSEEELTFWAQESAEHIELANHLLPLLNLEPHLEHRISSGNMYIVDELKMIANHRQELESLLPVYDNANRMALQLDELVRMGNDSAIQSLLHTIVEHEIKEGLRGESRIQQILGSF
jgi:hypothetical protein